MKLIFMKRADKEKNRIIIPKIIIEKFGREFILEVNTETGILTMTPIKKGE